MSIRSQFSTVTGSLCLTALLALSGCESMDAMLKAAPKPGVRVIGAAPRNLTLESVDLIFDLQVSNPYSVSLPLTDLIYSIGSGGHNLLQGNIQPSGAVPAGGSSVIQLPARLTFASLFETLKGVRPGSVIPYKADITLGVDAPIVGRLNLPVSKSGDVPVPAVPDVELVAFNVGALSFDKAEATARLRLKNTNQFALDLNKLGMEIALGGNKIARTGLTQSSKLASGQTATIDIPLSFAPRNFGMGLLNLLRGSDSGYSISGLIEAGTAYGPLSLPYSRSGSTSITR